MSEAKPQGGNPDRRRSSVAVSAKLDKKLFAYAAAASAAGVSLLTQSAEAKIVYTPANIQMAVDRNFSLDLNNDGIRDFIFLRWEYQGEGLNIKPTKLQPQNAILGAGEFASALSSGVTVGPNAQFEAANLVMAKNNCSSGFCSAIGPWKAAQNKYLGFSFLIHGKIHYGWARLNVSIVRNVLTGVVTGYAYETAPNTAIVTGQTQGADAAGPQASVPEGLSTPQQPAASLGLLASGASGLAAWRREEE
jgi:hypothetical protein